MGRKLCSSEKEKPLEPFSSNGFPALRASLGGDKRDRTADLLNAIQALSPYKRVANPLKGGGKSAFGTQE